MTTNDVTTQTLEKTMHTILTKSIKDKKIDVKRIFKYVLAIEDYKMFSRMMTHRNDAINNMMMKGKEVPKEKEELSELKKVMIESLEEERLRQKD